MSFQPVSPAECAGEIMRFLSSSTASILDKPAIYRDLYDFAASTAVIEAAIQICIDKGWLEVHGDGWRTTAAGFIETQRVAAEERLVREAKKARGEIWFNGLGLTLRSKRWANPLGCMAFVLGTTLIFGLPLWLVYRLR